MRTKMKMNDDKSNIIIDSNISSYDIKTVKMKMTFLQMTQYTQIHSHFCKLLKLSSFKNSTNDQKHKINRKFNMSIYQHFHHVLFSLLLKHLATTISAISEDNLI